MIPWDIAGHGLFHTFKTIWEEYEKNNQVPSPTHKKDVKGFIWVSQEMRDIKNKIINSVIDSVENGKTIPNYLYQTHPKLITEMLKSCNRLDLLPTDLNTTSTEQASVSPEIEYTEFEEINLKNQEDTSSSI